MRVHPSKTETRPPTEISVARIAALSGITGALIGAAATEIFALAAAQVTARSQIESQYLKPQRQTAYLQFMADESALRQVEQDALAEWAHGRRPDEAINEMPALLDKLHKSSDGVLVQLHRPRRPGRMSTSPGCRRSRT